MMETIPEEDINCKPDGIVFHLQLKAISVAISKASEGRKNDSNITGNIGEISYLKKCQKTTEVEHKGQFSPSAPVEIRTHNDLDTEINTNDIGSVKQRAIQDKPQECESESQSFEKKRTNTDIQWLFVILSFIFAWFFLSVCVGASSKTASFLSTYSTYKEKCPSHDKKYLLYFGLTGYFKNTMISSLTDIYILSKFCPSKKVCISECPITIWTAELYLKHILPFNYSMIENDLICVSEEIRKNITSLSVLEDSVNKDLCMREYSYSVPVLNLCLPNEILADLSATTFKWNVAINIAEFFYLCIVENALTLQMILTSSCVLLMIYICLLRWIAAPLFWISIIGLIFVAVIGLFYTVLGYYGIETSALIISNKISFVKGEAPLPIIFVILAAVLLLVVIKKVIDLIRLKHYIKPGLILLKESCKIVFQTKGSLIFIILVIHIYFALALWAWNTVICLMNNSNEDYKIQSLNNLSCNCTGKYENATEGYKCLPESFSQFCSNCICAKTDEIIFYFFLALQIFNLFALIWTTMFIYAFSKMVLACSLCRWYYNADEKEWMPFLIISSNKIIIRYHMGTAAYSSFGILHRAVYKIILVLRLWPKLNHLICSLNIIVPPPIHKYSLIICAINGTDLKNSTEKFNNNVVEDGERKKLNKVAQMMLNTMKWKFCLVLMIILLFIPHKNTYCSQINFYFLICCIFLISTAYMKFFKIIVDSLMYCYIQEQNSNSKTKNSLPNSLKGFF